MVLFDDIITRQEIILKERKRYQGRSRAAVEENSKSIMATDIDPLLETFTMDGHPLPGAWRHYLPEAGASLRLPGEGLATCENCYRADLGQFRADCRCCTYFPQLPNHMVGLALQDPRSAATLEALIDQGHLLPFGLVTSPQRYVAAVEAQANGLFGNAPKRLCPFARLATGGGPDSWMDCTIHPYRNSICSTYFCAFDHGEAGEDFWYRVQAFAGHVESSLSQWAMGQMGLDHGQYLQRLDSLAGQVGQMSARSSAGWPRHARQLLWDHWFGQERAFFVGCAELLGQHRQELYDLACAHPYAEAITYERALRAALPASCRDDVPPVSGDPDGFLTVETLWYRLQLASRNLWSLPFGEGPVTLGPGVVLEQNPRDDVASLRAADRPLCVRTADAGVRLFLTQQQADLLGLFSTPEELGERVMDSPQVAAVEDARGFLACMLRQQILVSR